MNTTSSHGNVRCQGKVYARTDPRTYEETHGIFSQAAIYLVSSLIFLPGTFSCITEARSISLDGTVNPFAPAFLLICARFLSRACVYGLYGPQLTGLKILCAVQLDVRTYMLFPYALTDAQCSRGIQEIILNKPISKNDINFKFSQLGKIFTRTEI